MANNKKPTENCHSLTSLESHNCYSRAIYAADNRKLIIVKLSLNKPYSDIINKNSCLMIFC